VVRLVDSPEEKMRRALACCALCDNKRFGVRSLARIVKPADKEEALAQNRRVCQKVKANLNQLGTVQY
jgi:hypothetical protein